MTARVALSPLAESDIVGIGDYISDGNPARATSFVSDLQAFLFKLAENPLIGRRRSEIHKGLRSIPFTGYRYTVYYRVLSKRRGIRVERVLHGARDLSALF